MKSEIQKRGDEAIWSLSGKYQDAQDRAFDELKALLKKEHLSLEEIAHVNYLYGLQFGFMLVKLSLEDFLHIHKELLDPQEELDKLRDTDPQTKGKRTAWRCARRDFRTLSVVFEGTQIARV